MATISDLRWINGHWIDTLTPDSIFGTRFADVINIYAGDNAVAALDGNDTIFDVHAYNGGYSGRDQVNAGAGDDLIVSSLDGAGNEYIGDAGIDRINFIPNTHGVNVDLAAHFAEDRATHDASQVFSIENVTGTGLSDYIYGDAARNDLIGYNGDDLLNGRAGADRLDGGRGRDVLFGGDQNDTLIGGEDGDVLNGQNGGDLLFGDAGNDVLIGGAGRDHMDGGAGRDKFVFNSLNESGATAASADVLGDFLHLSDRIDMSAIDANALVAGNQAFSFIGTAAFSAAGQIRYVQDQVQHHTFVLLNTDNDAAAEMAVRIDSTTALSTQDFIL